MKTIRALAALAIAFITLFASGAAFAQSALPQDNRSISVTTGLTYQTIAPADNSRHMVELQNNNTNTDNCWVNYDGVVTSGNTTTTSVTNSAGASIAASKASILLTPGNAATRYYPTMPTAAIVGTCTTAGDSIYVGIR